MKDHDDHMTFSDFLSLSDRPVGVACDNGCWGVGHAECDNGGHRGVNWRLLCLCSPVWSHTPSDPCNQQVREEHTL